MQGGVIGCTARFSNSCFNTFLQHSTVTYLSKGTYGVVLLVKINHAKNSPYIDLSRNPVKTLIVKVGLVTDKTNLKKVKKNPVALTSVSDFQQEHRTQENILRKSLEAFDSALCPAIVHIETVAWSDLKHSYPKLAVLMKAETTGILFSILAMETFPRVKTLHEWERTTRADALCFYLLVRLGAIGYAHGDPSLANIIVDEDNGRPYLIDFGHPVKLAAKDKNFMRTQLNGITDLPRVMRILIKGFPVEFPEMPNWDWVKRTTVAPEPPKANILSSFIDHGWRRIL